MNYATNVPEWQMGLTLEALAALGEVSSTCGKVQKAVAGDLAWTKIHPDSEYLGTLSINRVKACNEAASALHWARRCGRWKSCWRSQNSSGLRSGLRWAPSLHTVRSTTFWKIDAENTDARR